MKVFVCGTRGIPNVLGGIESHCEALYALIARHGIGITIARRQRYVSSNLKAHTYEGVNLVDIKSPSVKSLEAIVHTIKAVFYARYKHFRYLHIHGIGPSLVIPLARLIGFKVVMTHHGPDYNRQKWNRFAKRALRTGEWCAARFANEIIVISKPIDKIMRKKYGRNNAHLIHNGVTMSPLATETDYIRSLGLEPKKYIIAVGRIVPEKGLHDLLRIVNKINPAYKVVMVGDADHQSSYSQNIKEKAKKYDVIMPGFIKGEKLKQMFSHAALFVMPSYHEGLPIALLEALSYNLKVVVSNIPANREVRLEQENYFHVGDTEEFARKVNEQLAKHDLPNYNELIVQQYNWERIALETLAVYKQLMHKSPRHKPALEYS